MTTKGRSTALGLRAWLVRLHRWAGLLMAGFLFVAGVTGAVISWDHELDEWLNPQFNHAPGVGEAQSALASFTDSSPGHAKRAASHGKPTSSSPRPTVS